MPDLPRPEGGLTGTYVIFSNYDGGQFTIEVDTPTTDLHIGLVSYEAMTVTLTGAYLGNVKQVHYAGYNDTPGTSVTGIPSSKLLIQKSPPATLQDPNGNINIICAYSGGNAKTGGCNTGNQVEHFFATHFGGTMLFHKCQYWGFSGVLKLSAGGHCP